MLPRLYIHEPKIAVPPKSRLGGKTPAPTPCIMLFLGLKNKEFAGWMADRLSIMSLGKCTTGIAGQTPLPTPIWLHLVNIVVAVRSFMIDENRVTTG